MSLKFVIAMSLLAFPLRSDPPEQCKSSCGSCPKSEQCEGRDAQALVKLRVSLTQVDSSLWHEAKSGAAAGKAKIIASPTLLTASGQPAIVVIECSDPTNDEAESTVCQPVGTRLEILPEVTPCGRIRLECKAAIQHYTAQAGVVHASSGRVCQQSQVHTTLDVNPGELAVVAGLSPHHADCLPKSVAFISPFVPLTATIPHRPDQKAFMITITPELHQPTAKQHADRDCEPVCTATHCQPCGAWTGDVVRTFAECQDDQPVQWAQWIESLKQLTHQLVSSFEDFELEIELPDSKVMVRGEFEDGDQPHPPATLPATITPFSPVQQAGHELAAAEGIPGCPSGRFLFGISADGVDSIPCFRITEAECREVGACRSAACHQNSKPCCASKGDDECDEDEDDDAEDEIDAFIQDVLEAQMHYLQRMMHERLEHERTVMELKASLVAALVKQQSEHARQTLEVRTQHMHELERVKEQAWQNEKKAIEAQAKQAIEHERQIAELHRQHQQQMHAADLAAAKTQLEQVRVQLGVGSETANHARTAIPSPKVTDRPTARQLSVRVEDLQSGRVRYGIAKPAEQERPSVVLKENLDSLEQVEYTVPTNAISASIAAEIKQLRRELTRLQTIVEDLLCIAPESPPAPVPQSDESEQ